MNKENLKRMAEYIATIPQDKFDMKYFREPGGSCETHECNSVGCVIGHCTILDDWDNISKDINGRINFSAWSRQFAGLDGFSDEWVWCFSDEWKTVDNTPIGASKRILWLIKNGLPDDWCDQMLGESRLCYLD